MLHSVINMSIYVKMSDLCNWLGIVVWHVMQKCSSFFWHQFDSLVEYAGITLLCNAVC